VEAALDGDGLVAEGHAPHEAETSYELLAFTVPPGTERLEVGYRWEPADEAVIDLGLRAPGERFRGWSGSREGRLHRGQPPVFIEAGRAARGYLAGPIEPGIWSVELGFGDVPAGGVAYVVEIRCLSRAHHDTTAADDPVDPAHVADPVPGWYHADLHMHGYHSHPEAPDWDGAIEAARAAGLQICAFTEYVTTAHHSQLGAVQRAHPDLLIWPAREIITYFGHAVSLGATPSTTEYRVGHRGITMADIQRSVVADGALFGIAHPTVYPVEEWGNTCRGCEYRLDDQTDLDAVTTIEVVTVGAVIGGHRNPFVRTAIDRWEALLRQGHRVTAVAGSDDKLGDGYGATSTVIGAETLTVVGAAAALRRGRAYVKARPVETSPDVRLTVHSDRGPGSFGDTLTVDTAEAEVHVANAAGQVLTWRANGLPVDEVSIGSDDWTHRRTLGRLVGSGSLGTFWGFEVADETAPSVIANPVFLTGPDAL
jgi:hypothetical protein